MNFKNTDIITKFGQSYVPITLISIYAFFINWISANMGVMVIDTFSFFDSSFSILKNKLPVSETFGHLQAYLLITYRHFFF